MSRQTLYTFTYSNLSMLLMLFKTEHYQIYHSIHHSQCLMTQHSTGALLLSVVHVRRGDNRLTPTLTPTPRPLLQLDPGSRFYGLKVSFVFLTSYVNPLHSSYTLHFTLVSTIEDCSFDSNEKDTISELLRRVVDPIKKSYS